MAKRFANKKLLVLGSNAGSELIVNYARDNGAYVTVADYNPPEKSPAKKLADESWQISTGDIELLEKRVKLEEYDAVTSGISEFNILSAMELSSRCGLRFYCTHEQWDMVEKKDEFRELCIKHGVPCPQTYYKGSDETKIPYERIKYPVVVKPVDCGASIGVHICASKEELYESALDAKRQSDSGRLIVEEFCIGHEFTAHYTVVNGSVALACVDNRYPVAVHSGTVTTVPGARIYPSLFIEQYINKVDSSLRQLIADIGLEYGVVFVQGLYDENSESFSIFEAGLRSAAECPCRFIENVNGLNYLKMLVDYLLTGESDYDQSKEDPTLDGKCCGVVSFVGKHGVVDKIIGLGNSFENVLEEELRYPVGSEIPDTDTLRQLALRFVIVANDRNEMSDTIDNVNKNIDIISADGESLMLKLNPDRVFGLE